jgi:hypothetical protein
MDAKDSNNDNVDDLASDKVNENDFASISEKGMDVPEVSTNVVERMHQQPEKPSVIFSERYEGRPPIMIHRAEQSTGGTESANTAQEASPVAGPSRIRDARAGPSRIRDARTGPTFVISSTTDEDMEIVGESTAIPNTRGKRSTSLRTKGSVVNPKKRPRMSKRAGRIESTTDEEEGDASRNQDGAGQPYEPPQYATMTSMSIGKKVEEYLIEVDDFRKKSRNLKGTISHGMERCLARAREASEILANRAIASGDTVFLGFRVKELENKTGSQYGRNCCTQG